MRMILRFKEIRLAGLILKMKTWLLIVFSTVSLLQNMACIDPVRPQFDFVDGLVTVEGFASTSPGGSYVVLSESNIDDFGTFFNEFIPNAAVSFKNTKTNEVVNLIEGIGTYSAPDDFAVAVGDSWKLELTLLDGRSYESAIEVVLKPIPVSDVKVTYNSELYYNEIENGYVAGHFISADINDPADEENYYFWNFRSFENLIYCKKCELGYYRLGECIEGSRISYSYGCNGDCWRIRYNENLKIYSDEFSNGAKLEDLRIADIPFYNREDIVVEIQQFSISPKAYEYYKILEDLVDNNGSLNAPPPAALIGNIKSLTNNQEDVLGRFTAAGATVINQFIDRTNLDKAAQITVEGIRRTDPCVFLPDDCILTADCTETRFRTSFTPEGWQEQ